MNPKNDCKFIGRLSTEPETKTFDNGNGSVTTFSIAVKRGYKNNEGNYEADFFNCRAISSGKSRTGEMIAKYFHKGSPIILAGDLRNNNWTDKDGQKHFGYYINVSDFAFPEGGSKNESTSAAPQSMPTAQAPVTSTPPGFDQIPAGADNFLPFS